MEEGSKLSTSWLQMKKKKFTEVGEASSLSHKKVKLDKVSEIEL